MFKFFNKGSFAISAAIVIAVIALILVAGIFLHQIVTELFKRDVWLESWQYRRFVIIQNSRNMEVSDYPVLLRVDTSALIKEGKLASDCRDIRFTDPDSERFLPYWMEGKCDSKDARLWVKLPVIEPRSEKTIHFYYGNEAAESKALSLPPEDTFIAEITKEAMLSNTQRRCARDLKGVLSCVMPKANAIFLFQSKDGGKTWQEEKMSEETDLKQSHSLIILDSSNNINIIWQSGDSLLYRQKTADGWGEIRTISDNGQSPSAVIDIYNNMHIVFADEEGIIYYWRKAFFSDQEPMEIAADAADPSIIVSSEDDLFVVYTVNGRSIGWRERIVGHWSEEETITGMDPVIAVDSKSSIHLIYQETEEPQLVYRRKSAAGWQKKEILNSLSVNNFSLALDQKDDIYVVFDRSHESAIYLRKKDPNGWSKAEKIIENGVYPNLIWGRQPEAENIYSNIPRQGFALSYLSQGVRFYLAPFTTYQIFGSGLMASLTPEQNIEESSR